MAPAEHPTPPPPPPPRSGRLRRRRDRSWQRSLEAKGGAAYQPCSVRPGRNPAAGPCGGSMRRIGRDSVLAATFWQRRRNRTILACGPNSHRPEAPPLAGPGPALPGPVSSFQYIVWYCIPARAGVYYHICSVMLCSGPGRGLSMHCSGRTRADSEPEAPRALYPPGGVRRPAPEFRKYRGRALTGRSRSAAAGHLGCAQGRAGAGRGPRGTEACAAAPCSP